MVLSQSIPHHHHHIDGNDRSFLSILTDPIVNLFRSIPIEILDQNEELSPSQKDFLDDYLEIQIESDLDESKEIIELEDYQGSDEIEDLLMDILERVIELEQEFNEEETESSHLNVPELLVYSENDDLPLHVVDIPLSHQLNKRLQEIPVELTDSGIFTELDETQEEESVDDTENQVPVHFFVSPESELSEENTPTTSTSTNCSFIRSQSCARCKIILPDTSFVFTLPPVSATFSAPIVAPKKVVKRK
uniref:Highly acidic protein n=1 Tax=Caenorhabditis tropicalis TaxID=1561998 RepID=A0A1I7UA97_9PELO